MVEDFKRCQEMAEKVNCDGINIICKTDLAFVMCRKSGKSWKGESRMVNKTCATCIDNNNGLCDRKGNPDPPRRYPQSAQRGLEAEDAGEV